MKNQSQTCEIKTICVFKEKDKKAKEKAEKEAAKDAARRINPLEMFKQGEEGAKYKAWDEKGIPTHMADGEEVFSVRFWLLRVSDRSILYITIVVLNM